MLSMYALDSLQNIDSHIRMGQLVYSKRTKEELTQQLEETKEASSSTSSAPRLSPELVRLVGRSRLQRKYYHKGRHCQAEKNSCRKK